MTAFHVLLAILTFLASPGREFGQYWSTNVLFGEVIAIVGHARYKVRWDYGGDFGEFTSRQLTPADDIDASDGGRGSSQGSGPADDDEYEVDEEDDVPWPRWRA